MSVETKPSPHHIELITPDDEQEILNFLRSFFILNEPLSRNVGSLKDRETSPGFKRILDESDRGYSPKAIADGSIVGVCLNRIVSRGYSKEIETRQRPDHGVEKIIRLLHHVAVESDVFSHFPGAVKAMYVHILCVDTTWRGRGIAKELIQRTRELAKEQGCDLIYGDFTSHFSALAVKSLGFRCVYSLKYEDYKVDGRQVFDPEPPHEAVAVYAQEVLP